MGFDAIVHITTNRKVINTNRAYSSLNQELSGRRTDVDEIFNKLVVFPTALGVLGAKQHTLPGLQVMCLEIFRKNRLGVLDTDHTRQPNRGVEGHFIEPGTIRKEMPRRIHVRAGVRTQLYLGYVGCISMR